MNLSLGGSQINELTLDYERKVKKR
jgi:hypothetical protein